jgi:hypothetical protein
MTIPEALDEILAAFPPHSLDPAHAFDDWGTTYLDAERFERDVTGKQWSALPSSFWEFHHDALFFLGPSVMPQYLPGFLSAVLRRDPRLDALPGFLLEALTRREGERFDQRFACLTNAQRLAVRDALLALDADVAGQSRKADIAAALDSYWRAVAPAKD